MIRPEDNTFPILAVQTTYKCNMLCANCYLGDMLNNPKFADVDPTKLEELFKILKKNIFFIKNFYYLNIFFIN